MGKFILAIDQGTTGTTVLAISRDLDVIGRATHEFAQVFPKPAWVEHRAEDIWASIEAATADCLNNGGLDAADIAGIGITNQRETTCLFDDEGKALHNFIVWQCRRTAAFCDQLKADGHEEEVRAKTGLVLDAYFSGTKMRWLLDNVEGARERCEAGSARFGTIDSWLVYRLSSGAAHVTDATNASRTLLMNLETTQWDDGLLDLFGIPKAALPEIRSCSELYAKTQGVGFLPDGIPIAGIAGDQQAALFGQACFSAGQAKCTYGTGCFLLLNTGTDIVPSTNGLLTTVAIKLGDRTEYALEGAAFIGGAAVQWLRDGLGLIASAADIEDLAKSVDDAGDVVFVPALAGLGAPHWRQDARGLLRGFTRDSHKGHIARAVLDGIALQNRDILEAMKADAGALVQLKVDGGASANDLLMQIQSDVLGVSCIRPRVVETTALGAAALAGLAVGLFEDKQAVADAWRAEKEFTPTTEPADLIERWNAAVERA